jgi:hypothetical protein
MSYRVSSSQNQAARLLECWRVHACRGRQRRNRLVRHVVAGRRRQHNRSADRPHHQDPAKRRARMPHLTAVVTLVTSASRPPNRTAIGKILKLKYADAVHLDGVVDLLSPDSCS